VNMRPDDHDVTGRKVHNVTRRYNSAIFFWGGGGGAKTPGPIPIEFGLRVAPHDVINTFNFCNKI